MRALRVTEAKRSLALNADAADAAGTGRATVIAMPARVTMPDTQASATMPVMMVADASTMAIWKAAEASSKW